MPRTCFSELNYDIVWHVKDSAPLLTAQAELVAYQSIKQHLSATQGAVCHEVGGTETHVHLVASLPPDVLLSEFLSQLKGTVAHKVNLLVFRGRKVLEWQPGFGIISFGTKDLEWIRQYVRQQPEHHQRGTIHQRLERTEPPDELPAPDKPDDPAILTVK